MSASRRPQGQPANGALTQGPLFAWVSDVIRPPGGFAGSSGLSGALRQVRRHFLNALFFSAVISVLYLSSSIYMMLVYDKVLNSGSYVTLAMITLALMCALGTLAYLDFIRGVLLQRAGMRLDRTLSGPVMQAVLRDAAQGDTRRKQLLRDWDHVRGMMTGQAAQALLDAPWAPVFLLVLFILHWSLALLAIVGAVLFLGIARHTERRLREPTRLANEATQAVASELDGSLRNAGAIRAMGMEASLVNRWLDQREASRGASTSAVEMSLGSTSLLKFLRLLWQSLALGLGAWLAIEGKIAPGAMIASSILIGRTLAPLEQLLGAWRTLVSGADAYARLKATVWSAPDSSDRTTLPTFSGRVDVEGLGVRGVGGVSILEGLSFGLAPGETLGVIGSSGAGKSTLARALLGLAPGAVGAIRYDGAELSQWRVGDLSPRIGYLPQDIGLLPGTVRDNVSRFERQGANPSPDVDAQVVAACQAAGVHEAILRLPLGYDTPIEGGMINLSGGQKQRLALARALYRSPPLVILDEPNSNLDNAGEAALLATLRDLRERQVTVVVITHRMNLLMTAHKILVLNGGRVQAYGARDEIMPRLMPAPARPGPSLVPSGGTGS